MRDRMIVAALETFSQSEGPKNLRAVIAAKRMIAELRSLLRATCPLSRAS
jgi:hypothetical protein